MDGRLALAGFEPAIFTNSTPATQDALSRDEERGESPPVLGSELAPRRARHSVSGADADRGTTPGSGKA